MKTKKLRGFAANPELAKTAGSKGGKATSGYGFAHGKVDPIKAGKLKKGQKL